MFDDMLEYSTSMLNAISDFLSEPPMFYLFGLIILAFVVKIILSIIRPH